MVAYFWYLPDHVFGMQKYKQQAHGTPKAPELIIGFPYAIVRHPAAASFIWMYATYALLDVNVNRLLLSSLWTLFIVIGTLYFEEGGLRSRGEFGKSYEKYAAHVWAFAISPWSLRWLLSGGKLQIRQSLGCNRFHSVVRTVRAQTKLESIIWHEITSARKTFALSAHTLPEHTDCE